MYEYELRIKQAMAKNTTKNILTENIEEIKKNQEFKMGGCCHHKPKEPVV